jgi:hypothetical protein
MSFIIHGYNAKADQNVIIGQVTKEKDDHHQSLQDDNLYLVALAAFQAG